MDNATTRPGPVPGNPYKVIVLTGGFTVESFNYPDPVDALIGALVYLRSGRQVRLSDRTCAALQEAPVLAQLDKALSRLGSPGPALAFRPPMPGFSAPGAVPVALD